MKSSLIALTAFIALLSFSVSASNNITQDEPLKAVFDNYFQLKDALVKSNSKSASTESAELFAAIKVVKMVSLTENQQSIWIKMRTELEDDAESISKTTDVARQRDHFITLSKNIYELQKASKSATPVYYQFCPMANKGKGANWLSLESSIKNPYYGSQMLTCGKTVETIK